MKEGREVGRERGKEGGREEPIKICSVTPKLI